MFSKWFGTKKQGDSAEEQDAQPADCSFLATDLHSHFIPGIDDGAQTIEESIEMIRRLIGLGYKSIITTPHINYDHYPNTSEGILKGLQELHLALQEQGIKIPVRAAAEYFIDDYFIQILDREPLMPITQNQVLVEFSFAFQPVQLVDILFKMQTLSYRPIIAHPERYIYFLDKPDIYRELKDRGCLLQMNILSPAGYYGPQIKKISEKIMEQGLYDYCGTDMHNVRHADTLKKFMESKAFTAVKQYNFKNASIPIPDDVPTETNS
jgi:tyrosine-protein phosphatase YwqE